MSKVKKLSKEIVNYALLRKRKNQNLSCRELAKDLGAKFGINISKSSIGQILKDGQLSSPIGRRVVENYNPSSATISGTGYAMLLGANRMLGLSKNLASAIKDANPAYKMKLNILETISEAWILAKAIYNVSLEKIENYTKNDLWLITGKKVNKGHLKQYVEMLKFLQPVILQIVKDIEHSFQDVIAIKICLADDTQYFLDGNLKTIWKEPAIPINFSINIDIANSYVNSILFDQKPLVIFNAMPERVLGDEFSDFVFSMDGSSSKKRIRKIELVSSEKGRVIKEISFVSPQRRHFIVGVWPWQYKIISELEKKAIQGKFFIEFLNKSFYFVEEMVKFTQHINNAEVTLRLIVLKTEEDDSCKIAILTNLDAQDWDTCRVVQEYVGKHPDPGTEYKYFLKNIRNPGYFEEYVFFEKTFEDIKKMNDDISADEFFSVVVGVLNLFVKKYFFPLSCASWSLLKMKELFYRREGVIKRNMAFNVVFNLFNCKDLQQKESLEYAALKFNEFSIYDSSGKKLCLFYKKSLPLEKK